MQPRVVGCVLAWVDRDSTEPKPVEVAWDHSPGDSQRKSRQREEPNRPKPNCASDVRRERWGWVFDVVRPDSDAGRASWAWDCYALYWAAIATEVANAVDALRGSKMVADAAVTAGREDVNAV